VSLLRAISWPLSRNDGHKGFKHYPVGDVFFSGGFATDAERSAFDNRSASLIVSHKLLGSGEVPSPVTSLSAISNKVSMSLPGALEPCENSLTILHNTHLFGNSEQ
jgi:hypothetical protein